MTCCGFTLWKLLPLYPPSRVSARAVFEPRYPYCCQAMVLVVCFSLSAKPVRVWMPRISSHHSLPSFLKSCVTKPVTRESSRSLIYWSFVELSLLMTYGRRQVRHGAHQG